MSSLTVTFLFTVCLHLSVEFVSFSLDFLLFLKLYLESSIFSLLVQPQQITVYSRMFAAVAPLVIFILRLFACWIHLQFVAEFVFSCLLLSVLTFNFKYRQMTRFCGFEAGLLASCSSGKSVFL